MSPFIHGRIYPETESSTLVRRELNILIDPCMVTLESQRQLLDLDVLRHYLNDLPGQPCQINLKAPTQQASEHEVAYQLIRELGGEILPFASILLPEVVEAFGSTGESCPELMALISTALAGDADILVTVPPPTGIDLQKTCKTLSISVEDWATAKRSCEVFVRGHEVPWSFNWPAWGVPWTPFYSVSDRSLPLTELYECASHAGLDSRLLEDLRSLAHNRYASLCYTRDKLLFYVQQRRAAKRQKLRRQDFGFEVGYFLNHYYVLLWAGLDQICWITNEIFELGLTQKDWRKIGVLNQAFLKVLREKALSMAALFENAEFVKWVKMLRGARHFVAHRGIAMPGHLYLRHSEEEPSDEEIDREIENSNEWRELVRRWPHELVEAFRPQLRFQARLSKHEEVSEPILQIELDGQQVMIFPLVNIEWDYKNFIDFAHSVAAEAIQRISRGNLGA